MTTDPVSLALALPLLLLLAGLASLLLRDRGASAALGLAAAVLLAVGWIASGGADETRLSVRAGDTARIEAAADALLSRRDRDRDGRLDAVEARDLAVADVDADGALGRDDLLVALADKSDAWLAVGPLALDAAAPRGRLAPLFVPAALRLDRPSRLLALLFALVGLAIALHLAGDVDDGGRPRAWLALTIGAAVATLAAGNLVFALAGWLVTLALVATLQQSASLSGAPNRIGVGSFLFWGLIAASGLATLLLLGPSSEGPDATGRLGTLGAAALTATLLLPIGVLPFRPTPSRRWGGAWAVVVGVLLPLATLLLLRAGVPADPHPAAALLVAAAGALCALRALAETAVDRALSWLSLTQVGLVATALCLSCPPALTLALALTAGVALAALALAAEAVRDLAGGLALERLGGLKRAHPALCVGAVAAAAALLAVPPLPSFHAQRALLGHALGAGPTGVMACLPVGVALTLTAVTVVRFVVIAFRGAPPSAAGAPVRRSAAPVLLLALVVAGAGPLLGAGLTGEPLAWSLRLSEVAGLPTRVSAAAGLLLGLALVCGLSLAAWIVLSPLRQAPLAPPETARGWILRIDTRLEELTPQRRVVQPLLRLATRAEGASRRRLEDAPRAVTARAWRALTRLPPAPPAEPAPETEADREPPARPRLDPALRDAGVLVGLAALLILLAQRI